MPLNIVNTFLNHVYDIRDITQNFGFNSEKGATYYARRRGKIRSASCASNVGMSFLTHFGYNNDVFSEK